VADVAAAATNLAAHAAQREIDIIHSEHHESRCERQNRVGAGCELISAHLISI